MSEAEPKRGCRRHFRIAAADPAHREAAERNPQHGRAGTDMGENVGQAHAACDGDNQETRGERQRDPVRNHHGERSLAAANAIRAGKSSRRAMSRIMEATQAVLTDAEIGLPA